MVCNPLNLSRTLFLIKIHTDGKIMQEINRMYKNEKGKKRS